MNQSLQFPLALQRFNKDKHTQKSIKMQINERQPTGVYQLALLHSSIVENEIELAIFCIHVFL